MTRETFYKLINAIPREDLRDRVEDSALTNANDTMMERGRTDAYYTAEFWKMAIATAKMILDCPKEYYPELY